jgi:hypothetical protein
VKLRERQNENCNIGKIAILGPVVVVASAMVPPLKAQPVIDNPGRCAQFYPNANCQNLGPGNPFTELPGGWRHGYALGKKLRSAPGHFV